jgi:hypothetical protein
VYLNEKLIFSKLERSAFPDLHKIVEEVIKTFKGFEPSIVEDLEKEENFCCVIS